MAAAVAVFGPSFAPLPGLVHTVANADVSGETMDTGTLEAHLAAWLGPRVDDLTKICGSGNDRAFEMEDVLLRAHTA